MNTTTQTNLEVANTILAQLGGAGRLVAMLGAKDFMGDANSLTFKVGRNAKKVTCVRIVLNAGDTYDVTFYTGRGINIREADISTEVYVDRLRPTIERGTGMYLSL